MAINFITEDCLNKMPCNKTIAVYILDKEVKKTLTNIRSKNSFTILLIKIIS